MKRAALLVPLLMGCAGRQAIVPSPPSCREMDSFRGDTLYFDSLNRRVDPPKAATFRVRTAKDSGWEFRFRYASNCAPKDSFFALDTAGNLVAGTRRTAFINSKTAYSGNYVRGNPVDTHLLYYPDGRLQVKQIYPAQGGLGEATWFRPGGSLKASGQIWRGQWVGLWIYRDEWGRLMGKRFYENRQTLDSSLFNTDSIMTAVFRMSLQKKFRNFWFYSHPKDTAGLGEIHVHLDSVLQRLGRETGAFPDQPVKVYVHRSYENFNPPGYAPENAPVILAYALGSRKIHLVSDKNPIISYNFTRSKYRRLLTHELSHTVLAALSGDSALPPRWLFEGLALVQSDDQPLHRPHAKRALSKGWAPSIANLENGFAQDQWHAVRRNYQWSANLVQFLLDKYGWEKIRDFARHPRDLERIFGLDQEALSGQWHTAMKRELGVL